MTSTHVVRQACRNRAVVRTATKLLNFNKRHNRVRNGQHDVRARCSPDRVDLGDGDFIRLPAKRQDVHPDFDYSQQQAVEIQMQAVKDNNVPYPDHGIEVLYRFANFDPFERSDYFGRRLDLGQFERFRRVMHSPSYQTLLGHDSFATLSTLQVAERVWKTRLLVKGLGGLEERVFEFTMVQRLGGHYDGFWFTDKLVCDAEDDGVMKAAPYA